MFAWASTLDGTELLFTVFHCQMSILNVLPHHHQGDLAEHLATKHSSRECTTSTHEIRLGMNCMSSRNTSRNDFRMRVNVVGRNKPGSSAS